MPSGYNEGWFLNNPDTANPAMTDVNVRKAIAMAFNRQKIVDDLLLGKPPFPPVIGTARPTNDPMLSYIL
ncbi:MAG: hypothetical protein R3E39_17595 [Anaerolineae bacterium]